ncbi:MAG: NUDIX hydrolase [Clostridiales bacterium]|nr:NUDIX hydrolase [Clostridiales bacterium]
MIFEEKKIDSHRIYEGAILNVRRDTVTAVKGQAYREIIEHNGAVAMVAITDEQKIVMVRQYRYACGRSVLEIPAGKIDKGESDPLKAAVRELKEETGYTAGKIKYLGKINTSVAYSEEVIHIYAMCSLTLGQQDLDDDEALEVVEYPFMEIYEMAAGGRLVDAKTVAALLMAKEQLGEEVLP